MLLGMSVNVDAAILSDTEKVSTVDIVSTHRCIALFSDSIELLCVLG